MVAAPGLASSEACRFCFIGRPHFADGCAYDCVAGAGCGGDPAGSRGAGERVRIYASVATDDPSIVPERSFQPAGGFFDLS